MIRRFLFLIFTSILLTGCFNSSDDKSGGDLFNGPTTTTPTSPSSPTPVITGPAITNFIEPFNGTYAENGILLFQVEIEEAVTISGTPRLSLNIGGSTRNANYVSGSGTQSLVFSYTVQASENDADGIALNSFSIDLNSGSILSDVDSDPLQLSFASFIDSLGAVIVNTASGITPPNQVSSLVTAPTISNTSLAVSWAVPNNNGTSIINYALQYRQFGQTTWINISPSPTANSTSVNGLTEGVTYEFRVAANNGLLGAFSAVHTATIFDVMSLNPIAWLDATNINGNGSSPVDGSLISSWVDLTGAASNAVEADTSKQPTIEYNVQNGLPAVRFANKDRGLEGTFTRAIGTDLTFIVVGQFDTGYSDRCFFEFKGPGSERGFFIDQRYASNTNYSPVLTKNSFQVWRIEDDGSNAKVTENASTSLFNGATFFGTDFTGNGTYVLGDDATGGNRMYGYIAEFLIFDRALTVQELSTLETYLKNKWGTP